MVIVKNIYRFISFLLSLKASHCIVSSKLETFNGGSVYKRFDGLNLLLDLVNITIINFIDEKNDNFLFLIQYTEPLTVNNHCLFKKFIFHITMDTMMEHIEIQHKIQILSRELIPITKSKPVTRFSLSNQLPFS